MKQQNTLNLKNFLIQWPTCHMSHLSGGLTSQVYLPVRYSHLSGVLYQSGVLTCQVCLSVRCAHLSGVLTCQVYLPVRCAYLSGVLTCQVCSPARCTYLSGVLTCQVCSPFSCAHLIAETGHQMVGFFSSTGVTVADAENNLCSFSKSWNQVNRNVELKFKWNVKTIFKNIRTNRNTSAGLGSVDAESSCKLLRNWLRRSRRSLGRGVSRLTNADCSKHWHTIM